MKLKNTKDYRDLFENLKSNIKFDTEKGEYVLDLDDANYTELKEYLKSDNVLQINSLLKIWIHELEQTKIGNELEEDAIITFFKVRYFMNLDPLTFSHSDKKRYFVGLGNSILFEE
jgi:hypothetical protein